MNIIGTGRRLEHTIKVKDMSEELSQVNIELSGVKIEMYKILLTLSVRCARRKILSQPSRKIIFNINIKINIYNLVNK